MIGAIVGDVVGSRFMQRNWEATAFSALKSPDEVDGVTYSNWSDAKAMKSKEFSLFGGPDDYVLVRFTNGAVLSLAIAQAILDWRAKGTDDMAALSAAAVDRMQKFAYRYRCGGFFGEEEFQEWLRDPHPQPCNSWGYGAAIRVSACGWAGRTLDEVKALSRAVTEVTHNHPEGIKGAEATAVCVFLARQGKSKDEIKAYVTEHYYSLDFTLDEIRPSYHFDESCQGTVPQAREAFFESTSFEDAIRNAISIGGDSDTIGAICGAVAETFYGVPEEIRTKALTFLPQHLVDVLKRFETVFRQEGE